MSLISMNLAGVRGRNRWGRPFIHISPTNATPISVLFVPNIALRGLSHASAEERHMQRSSGPFYPHIMNLCARLLAWGADLAAQRLFYSINPQAPLLREKRLYSHLHSS
jgi:hypothetical protein